MSAKRYVKIAALVALALLGYGRVTGAFAGQEKEKKAPGYHSSIQVPASEKNEAKLQAAAKITAEQAKTTAIEKHKGWAVRYVKIKNLKGNLVYEVEFQDDKEYMIDAGTGELLTTGKESKNK